MSSRYEDIHYDQLDIRQSVAAIWNNGDYEGFLEQMESPTLTNKKMEAAALNHITEQLAVLQEYKDDGFKQDIIKVTSVAPPLNVSQIYFKIV